MCLVRLFNFLRLFRIRRFRKFFCWSELCLSVPEQNSCQCEACFKSLCYLLWLQHHIDSAVLVYIKQASHWHAFCSRNAMPRNMRANEGRTRDSVRGDVWRCGARWSSAYHVVAKILKCFIFFKVSRLVTTTLWSTHAWHWVSHTSWTVRALCVIDGTTCHDMAQTMRYLAVLTDFVPLKWHDLARHIAWHCIAETKFVPVCGLLKSPNTTAFLMMRPNWTLKHPSLTN